MLPVWPGCGVLGAEGEDTDSLWPLSTAQQPPRCGNSPDGCPREALCAGAPQEWGGEGQYSQA